MFTIGEFSKVTGLTVKTLRFYHEEGLLAPSFIDPRTGYRHYHPSQIETARIIAYLRGVEFPLAEIKEILRHGGDDEGLLDAVERQKSAIEQKIRRLRKAARSLEQFISDERQARDMSQATYDVREKGLDPVLVGALRMKGRYSDCGKGFGRLGRALGRYICGKPFLLHYDTEYKEDDAEFEVCFPIRQARSVDGISVRELPGGRCLSLLHKGPYDQLGHAYARILKHVKEKGYGVVMPTREVYLKGPGMIFKGNPRNYLTEIQIPVADERSGPNAIASA
jgi:DNA-binding transcriptional MerR regulator/effector-binding domain-containing protein